MNTVTLELTDTEVDALVELLDRTRLACGRHCDGCQKFPLRSVRTKLSRLVMAHPAEL